MECEDLDIEMFNVTENIRSFIDLGGETYPCTSCMKIRQKGSTKACPLSTMADPYHISTDNIRVLSL